VTAIDLPRIIASRLLIKLKKEEVGQAFRCGSQVPSRQKQKITCSLIWEEKRDVPRNKILPRSFAPQKQMVIFKIFYDNDIMSDDGASCLSIPDDNGLFFANSDEDDTFRFSN
jgi:hypothetical protein